MPWTYPSDVPDSMKYLKPSIQRKAVSIANAILRNGADEGTAIATAIKNAKKHHDKKGTLVKLAFRVNPNSVFLRNFRKAIKRGDHDFLKNNYSKLLEITGVKNESDQISTK